MIEAEPLVAAIDYVAVVNADTMAPWEGDGPCLLAAAIRIGSVRLIDNIVLD